MLMHEDVYVGASKADDARKELNAVEHELGAVREILDRLNEPAAGPAEGDADAWSDEDDTAPVSAHLTAAAGTRCSLVLDGWENKCMSAAEQGEGSSRGFKLQVCGNMQGTFTPECHTLHPVTVECMLVETAHLSFLATGTSWSHQTWAALILS